MKKEWAKPLMNELAVSMTQDTKVWGYNDGTLVTGIPGIDGCATVGYASGCSCGK